MQCPPRQHQQQHLSLTITCPPTSISHRTRPVDHPRRPLLYRLPQCLSPQNGALPHLRQYACQPMLRLARTPTASSLVFAVGSGAAVAANTAEGQMPHAFAEEIA
ncbi:hypothetical protein DFH27DRAFT_615635 [Peziza echinospora]|nr:hypothetical protein DFH27DRAFT_615635 [Peziza echinospora]